MEKIPNNQKVTQIFRALKPWIITLAIVLFLRFSGALAGISFLTNTALMKTGILDAEPGEGASKKAPFDYDFVVKDLHGNKVDFNQFKNKVVFLNMWATWCGPCKMEMPSIQELYEKVDHDKVIFVMLSIDKEEHYDRIVKYIDDKKFTFPVYQHLGYLPKQLRVSVIPTTFVIGMDGKIKDKKVGAANYDTEEFQHFLEELTTKN